MLDEMLAAGEEPGDRRFELASLASVMDALSERQGDHPIEYGMAVDLPTDEPSSDCGPPGRLAADAFSRLRPAGRRRPDPSPGRAL